MRALPSIAGALLLSLTPLAASADEVGSGLPDPPLFLSLSPGASGAPWKLKIENTGEVPVRLAADARLLSLEVTPPAGSAAETALRKKGSKSTEPVVAKCELPADIRPTTDEGRELVVPGKRSFTVSFDPFFYCFGAKERGALVNGATVKARFGFPTPAPKTVKGKVQPLTSPFVAVPVGAAVGKLGSVKAVTSNAITLAEDVKVVPVPVPATPGTSTSGGGIEVTTGETLDVARGSEITVTVTLTNTTDHSVTSLFRPEMIRFLVSGPNGTVSCGTPRVIASPIRELFGTIPVKGKTSISLLVTSVCGSDTFDDAGIYRVSPTFDSSGASGQSIRLKTWDGEVSAKSPLLLRVRSPKRASTVARPSLD